MANSMRFLERGVWAVTNVSDHTSFVAHVGDTITAGGGVEHPVQLQSIAKAQGFDAQIALGQVHFIGQPRTGAG